MKVIKNVVQPEFNIGETIRFKSTGEVEKVRTITHGCRFINSVSVKDIEKISEDDYCNSKQFAEEVRIV